MKISLLALIFMSQHSFASGLSHLASPYREGFERLLSNFQTSAKISGIEKPYSKEDCFKLLAQEKKAHQKEQVQDVIYFLEEYPKDHLYADAEKRQNCEGYEIGFSAFDLLKPNSYDESVLTRRSCSQYIELKKVEVVEVKIKSQTKTCRKISLQMGKETFSNFVCLGDHHSYMDFNKIPVKVLQEVKIKD